MLRRAQLSRFTSSDSPGLLLTAVCVKTYVNDAVRGWPELEGSGLFSVRPLVRTSPEVPRSSITCSNFSLLLLFCVVIIPN